MRLVEAVFWSKLIIKAVVGGILLFVGGYYFYKFFIYSPPAPTEIFIPDYGCGTITIPQIPKLDIQLSDLVPEVTASQAISIKLPPIAYVYKIPFVGETFSTKTKAKQLASLLSFIPEHFSKPNPITLQWRDKATKRTLTINTRTFSFTYSYDFSKYPKVPNQQIPATSSAPELANQILSTLGLQTEDLANGRTLVYPVLFTDAKNHHMVDALIKAQAVRVDYQRPRIILKFDDRILRARPQKRINFEKYIDLDEKSKHTRTYKTFTVTASPYSGNVRVFLKANNYDVLKGLLRLEYNYLPIDSVPCGTYPIIKPEAAIAKIKEGQAAIVALVDKTDKLTNLQNIPPVKNILISRIELNYLEPTHSGSFLIPVYVVYGDIKFTNGNLGEIVFYVPAIEKTSP